jgi:glutamine synthetase type III
VLVTRLGAGSAPPAVPSVVAGITVEAVLDGW